MRGETREVRRVKNRALRRGAGVAALYALLAAVLLAGSTFAWFTFRAYTNVTPLAGTIGTGEGDLLISARRDGGFDTQCALPLRDAGAELLPVSISSPSAHRTGRASPRRTAMRTSGRRHIP